MFWYVRFGVSEESKRRIIASSGIDLDCQTATSAMEMIITAREQKT